MTETLMEKRHRLEAVLEALGSCVVGFSGGVDSTLLLAVATRTLGDRVLAVSATSETYPLRELEEARHLARELGCRHRVIASEELDIPGFADNPPDRCYHCKQELFGKLREVAAEEGLAWVVDGSNLDDRGDYRPGRRAARELGVRSPLEEVKLTKEEIRQLSRQLGLPTWDKPALACLSSRFPYGERITRERVAQVGRAEQELWDLGLRTLRVRHHGDVARLELGPEEYRRVVGELREEVARRVKAAGYLFVAVDLQGYRTGSMNDALPAELREEDSA